MAVLREGIAAVGDKHVIPFDPSGDSNFSWFLKIEFVLDVLLFDLIEEGLVDVLVRLYFWEVEEADAIDDAMRAFVPDGIVGIFVFLHLGDGRNASLHFNNNCYNNYNY